MSPEESETHNRLFREASHIIENEIPLHERPNMPKPGWFLGRRLRRAIKLFEEALKLNPENWSAMWLTGKVHQRFHEKEKAFSWFERAYQVNPSQTDIAREASMCAMDLGRSEAAIAFAHRATQIEPENSGLHANLALAYLLAGKTSRAAASIERALAGDPSDKIFQTVQSVIHHFAQNGQTPPKRTPDLLAYWSKNKGA
jgi:tetratricopeptide (TPR) repeat protein